MRMLTFDIETRPHEGATWGPKHETNILWWTRYGGIISIAWKWSDEKRAYCKALPDYSGYRVGHEDDRKLLIEFCKVAEEADVFIYQNGDKFDLRYINARLAFHRLPPLQPRQTIDTLKIFRKYFLFPANNLDEVCAYLKIGRKTRMDKTDWEDIVKLDVPEEIRMRKWRKMKQYNPQDVILTEDVCKVVLPYTHNAIPNYNVYEKTILHCTNPHCGSSKVIKRGTRRTATGEIQAYQCTVCGKYSQGRRLPVHTKDGQKLMLK